MSQKKHISSPPSLKIRGGDLLLRWYWEWYDDKGKRSRIYIPMLESVDKRMEEAHRLYRERYVMDVRIEDKNKHLPMVIRELLPYAEKHMEGLRDSTKKDYHTILRIFGEWMLAQKMKDLPVNLFTKVHAAEFVRYMAVVRKASNETHNKYVNTLKMLFSYLLEYDRIGKNPFQYIKRKQKNHVSYAAFMEADVERMKAAILPYPTVYVSCMMSLYAFIRPKEVRKLTVGHLDFERGIITVPGEISKNKKTMNVIMFPALKEILQDYIGSEALPNDYFLLSKTGKPSKTPISSSYVARTHAEIMQANGFDTLKFKPYSWKHTGNSIAYKNGASLKFLKMQNRHHNEATTEIYLKNIVPEHLAECQAQFFEF